MSIQDIIETSKQLQEDIAYIKKARESIESSEKPE